MKTEPNDMTAALHELTRAVRSISHGPLGVSGGEMPEPMGLELLAIAVAGQGVSEPLASAVGSGLSEIAGALREGLDGIADAVRETSRRGKGRSK